MLAYVGAELRGSAQLQLIPSLGQYRAVLSVYSNIPTGEPLTFRVGYTTTTLSYPVTADVPLSFKADSVRGTLLIPLVLHGTFAAGQAQFSQSLIPGWNMVALPLRPADARRSVLYPTATSKAYRFKLGTGYIEDDTLDIGNGYWVNFGATGALTYGGTGVDSATFALDAGWNLIGGISADVRVAQVLQSPASSLSSAFFYYANGYFVDTLVRAGKAYWVKTSRACQITLKGRLGATDLMLPMTDVASLRTDELPPPPPVGVEEKSEDPASVPQSYALGQNYPNPFNPTTVIRYQLPVESRVSVTVYDVLGRAVARLVDGVESAGMRTVRWDASAAATGVYFYRLDATGITDHQSFSEVKKMLLVR